MPTPNKMQYILSQIATTFYVRRGDISYCQTILLSFTLASYVETRSRARPCGWSGRSCCILYSGWNMIWISYFNEHNYSECFKMINSSNTYKKSGDLEMFAYSAIHWLLQHFPPNGQLCSLFWIPFKIYLMKLLIIFSRFLCSRSKSLL